MFYSHRQFFGSLLIIVLFLLPTTQAASNESFNGGSQLQVQIQQLQAQIIDANGKIKMLESELQSTAKIIGSMQAALDTTNQNVSTALNSEAIKLNHSNQIATSNTAVRRMANGHGR